MLYLGAAHLKLSIFKYEQNNNRLLEFYKNINKLTLINCKNMTLCIFLIVIFGYIRFSLTKNGSIYLRKQTKLTVALRASLTECKFRTLHYFGIGIVCTVKCEKVGESSASKIVQPCFHEIM